MAVGSSQGVIIKGVGSLFLDRARRPGVEPIHAAPTTSRYQAVFGEPLSVQKTRRRA